MGADIKIVQESELHEVRFSDLILITTPDNVIGLVAERLSRLARSWEEKVPANVGVPRPARRVVLHASGALSSGVLAPLKETGFAVGSMHPLVSVSDPASDPRIFHKAFFCLEGDRLAINMARAITRDLGGQSFSLSANNKPLYHAAAVMSSGHLVALFDITTEMLRECGLSERRARAVLMPLLQSTVDSLTTRAPAEALTGTFARGEVGTARHHLAALGSRQLRDALATYKVLGKRSLRLAAKRGMSPAAQLALAKEIDSA
jgi:predicted short-subunit dehydrogenase-like oxidoreductase (DUF2520 family)